MEKKKTIKETTKKQLLKELLVNPEFFYYERGDRRNSSNNREITANKTTDQISSIVDQPEDMFHPYGYGNFFYESKDIKPEEDDEEILYSGTVKNFLISLGLENSSSLKPIEAKLVNKEPKIKNIGIEEIEENKFQSTAESISTDIDTAKKIALINAKKEILKKNNDKEVNLSMTNIEDEKAYKFELKDGSFVFKYVVTIVSSIGNLNENFDFKKIARNTIAAAALFGASLSNVKAEPPKINYNEKQPITITDTDNPIKNRKENIYTIKVEYNKNQKKIGKAKNKAFENAMGMIMDKIGEEAKNDYEIDTIDIWDKNDGIMIVTVKYHELEED
jgi:hypothetical protein